MRIRSILIVAVLVALGFGVGRLSAAVGTVDSPDVPGNTLSYTLEDIYNRLDTGAGDGPSAFTEPAAGPGAGTMHDLNEIMGQAPAEDNTDGAVPGEVLTGKTYWSLRTDGTWGPQGGTAAAGSNVSGPEGAKSFTIPDGLYSGSKTCTANDSDLGAGNIKCGVDIFGVTGSIPQYVAKTGQTTSYATGDDGGYRNGGLPVVAPSDGYSFGGYNRTSFTCSGGFTDNGNGTVTDNLTGLIWLKNANCTDTVGGIDKNVNSGLQEPGELTWANALTWSNNLASGDCGLADGSSAGDWRLPNINELRSLFDLGLSAPYVPQPPFTGVQSDYYWSSTTYAGNTSSAWIVLPSLGYVVFGNKTLPFHVWPVRGGQ